MKLHLEPTSENLRALNPLPQRIFLVVTLRNLVGIHTGPFTLDDKLRFMSFVCLTKSACAFCGDFMVWLVRVISFGEWLKPLALWVSFSLSHGYNIASWPTGSWVRANSPEAAAGAEEPELFCIGSYVFLQVVSKRFYSLIPTCKERTLCA